MKYLGKKIVTLIMTLFVVSAAAFIAFQILRWFGISAGRGACFWAIWASATAMPRT